MILEIILQHRQAFCCLNLLSRFQIDDSVDERQSHFGEALALAANIAASFYLV